jgi:hypothetical protein
VGSDEKKGPFFVFFYADDDIICAQGRGAHRCCTLLQFNFNVSLASHDPLDSAVAAAVQTSCVQCLKVYRQLSFAQALHVAQALSLGVLLAGGGIAMWAKVPPSQELEKGFSSLT